MRVERLTKLLRDDQRGMTLTEVLAAMAVSLVFMAAAMGILNFSFSELYTLASLAEGQRITEHVRDLVGESVRYTDLIEIDSSDGGDGERSFVFTGDGKFLMNDVELFEESFYRRRRIYCEACLTQDGILDFTVFLENKNGDTLSSARSVVKLVNLELLVNEEEGENRMAPEERFGSRDKSLCFRYRIPQIE